MSSPHSVHSGIPQPTGEARKTRILVAPLDWGLGHATRCIPVIYELLRLDCEVWLGAEKAQEILLRQEFPELPVLQLPGYGVKYGRSAGATRWNILRQSRRITRAIQEEHNWLKEMVEQYRFDAVIADNRFGLYHQKVHCVFITHQLTIKTPFGKWLERVLQKRNYSYINHFSECWVPDEEGENNLAGELSHPAIKPSIPVYYIGILSRLKEGAHLLGQPGNLLILLSGPEPQRSILEDKILGDLANYNGTATIVRGLPGAPNHIPSTNKFKFYNHLPAMELSKEMENAEYIISRSGYSTVMDIATLQKKTILIPTPGQTEQEYLATLLHEKNLAFTVPQKTFLLSSALQSAHNFSYNFPDLNNDLLRRVVPRFIASLHNN